ncbi:TetR/AcrR family transcriptional regulator [Desulfogranum japonicum]|uniref:TetR/AcrR family transcriptional regulator n=1 Tax=Desulfogranum japonicum TaxID=231447 RepID=UPI00040FF3A4|nr:TetR/AcrR family transcriptional regulator [Desulfogranum japonicum]
MQRSSPKKDAILREATKLFSENGYWDTSISDIAHATGVAEGTIFYHFHSKEELFLAVLQKFKTELISSFHQFLDTHEFADGLEMLEASITFYLQQTRKMEERFLLLHRHHYYQIAEDNQKCWHHLEDIYSSLISIFEQAIIKGQKDCSIKPVSTKNKALLIFTLVDGLVRLNTYKLYRADELYNDLIESCRSMLQSTT